MTRFRPVLPRPSALVLDNTFGDAETATNVALATDLARLFVQDFGDVDARCFGYRWGFCRISLAVSPE